jgi:hypothetical protein
MHDAGDGAPAKLLIPQQRRCCKINSTVDLESSRARLLMSALHCKESMYIRGNSYHLGDSA